MNNFKKKIYVIIVLILLVASIVLAINIVNFDDGSSSGNFTITTNVNQTLNLSFYKYANISSAFINLTGYSLNYYLDESPSGYATAPLRNITGFTYSVFATNILGQNVSMHNKEIDKISWKWGCTTSPCEGNISYKARRVSDKSIIASCEVGIADVGPSYAYHECDFTDFNTGTDDLIFTIELTAQANTTHGIDVLAEGASTGQNANGDNDFWGQQWSYYPSREPPAWELLEDTTNNGKYYVINFTFTDGKNYAYPETPSLSINNTPVYSLENIEIRDYLGFLKYFNDSTIYKNFTYNYNTTQTSYFKISNNTNITYATLSLSGYKNSTVINNDTEFNGSYVGSGSGCFNCGNAYDEDWNTYASALVSDNQTVYENYSFNPNITKSIEWVAKVKEIQNLSATCGHPCQVRTESYYWDFSLLSWNLLFYSDCSIDSPETSEIYANMTINTCNKTIPETGLNRTSGLLNIKTIIVDDELATGGSRYYEGAINITQKYPSNVSIKIGSSEIYFYNGDFNQTNNITNDFTSKLKEYSNSTYLVNGFYVIPLNIYSASAGIVQVSNINISLNNFSRSNNFASILMSKLSSGTCNGGFLNGNNCTIDFVFNANRSGKLEYSNLNINWRENIFPNLTINTPNGEYSSQTVSYNLSVAEDYALDKCFYWITRGASLEVANTSISCSGNTTNTFLGQTQVTGDASYVFHLFVNDTSGNSNYTNSTFTTETSGGGGTITPGGGGGGTIFITEGNWSISTQGNGNRYQLNMIQGTERSKSLYFENLGIEEKSITLSCETPEGKQSLCQYLFADKTEFTLPLIKSVKTIIDFDVKIPETLQKGDYSGNIIATDEDGNKGFVTVDVNVGNFNFLVQIATKLTSSKDFGGTQIPYLVIFGAVTLVVALLSGFIFFKDVPGGSAFSFVIGLALGGVGLLIL